MQTCLPVTVAAVTGLCLSGQKTSVQPHPVPSRLAIHSGGRPHTPYPRPPSARANERRLSHTSPPPAAILVRCEKIVLRPKAEAPSGACRREERCDDRKAPGGTKCSRHAPRGSCEAAGVERWVPRSGVSIRTSTTVSLSQWDVTLPY